ncbi:hypothetical protein [Falsirhodobacter deserti]|uniref:hypothetical protein n=1 Tax=Falsirhodobacter deserti TaxID=1365611 RepID=UPI000FE2E8EF|nr:hypothetical protein [Falsirhodobacter deserti]
MEADHPNTGSFLHAGSQVKATPTDEGVKVFSGLWFNSDELQACREGHQGKVSVFIDPDDVTLATVLMLGVQKPITVTLQITAFADLTLPEVLEIVQIGRSEDPRLIDVYEDRLARIRRERYDSLRAIGVEKNLKRSYSTLDECTKKARVLFAGTRILRASAIEGTVAAGQITDMSSDVNVFRFGDDMVIEGECESAVAIDPWGADDTDDDAVPTTDSNAAEDDAVIAPQPKRRSPRKPKTAQQKPIALGRPTKLKDFE